MMLGTGPTVRASPSRRRARQPVVERLPDVQQLAHDRGGLGGMASRAMPQAQMAVSWTHTDPV